MGNWQVDGAHTSVNFAVKHMMVTTVRGTFTEVSVTDVDFDPDHLDSGHVTVKIRAASISTGEARRDGHLRSADFLDAEMYPELIFESTSIEKAGAAFRIHGDLTIKDVTRPVVLETEYNGVVPSPMGGLIAGFDARTKISRKEWGLNWNVALESGGWLVADEIRIDIEVELVQPAQVPTAAGAA
jgi:polyisoprenoid-binding protein YceI